MRLLSTKIRLIILLSLIAANGGRELFSQDTFERQAQSLLKKYLFLRQTFDKTSAVLGEQITVSYKLYAHKDLRIVDLQDFKAPAFQGFWTTNVDLGELKYEDVELSGVPYRVSEIKRVIIIPQKGGVLTPEPMEVQAIVQLRTERRPDGSIATTLTGTTGPTVEFKDFRSVFASSRQSIRVKPLPAGAPASFHGAVGNLDMQAWISKSETLTDEPVTLTIKIRGEGNLDLINTPKLSLPVELESYEPKVYSDVKAGFDGITGAVTFEYYLQPRKTRLYVLKPFEFTFFNPTTGQYVTERSGEFFLNVRQGKPGEVSGLRKEEIKLLGRDIMYIKDAPTVFHKMSEAFFGSPPFLFLLFSPIALSAIFIVYIRRRRAPRGSEYLIRSKLAGANAKRGLAKAKKYGEFGAGEEFMAEINKSLWDYLSDKLSIPRASISINAVAAVMKVRNYDPELINEAILLLSESDRLRYAPSGETSLSPVEIYDRACAFVLKIEEEGV